MLQLCFYSWNKYWYIRWTGSLTQDGSFDGSELNLEEYIQVIRGGGENILSKRTSMKLKYRDIKGDGKCNWKQLVRSTYIIFQDKGGKDDRKKELKERKK